MSPDRTPAAVNFTTLPLPAPHSVTQQPKTAHQEPRRVGSGLRAVASGPRAVACYTGHVAPRSERTPPWRPDDVSDWLRGHDTREHPKLDPEVLDHLLDTRPHSRYRLILTWLVDPGDRPGDGPTPQPILWPYCTEDDDDG